MDLITNETLAQLYRSVPLPRDQQNILIAACRDLIEDRARLLALLEDLREPWAQVRATMNELQTVVTPPPFVPRPSKDR